MLRSGFDRCIGDLRAKSETIILEPATGPMPAPRGGTIADGTYDLIAIHQYERDLFAQVYLRAAFRFSAAAIQAEHVYDPDSSYQQTDGDSSHRLMSVATEGTVLHFAVSCPTPIIFPTYDRGYTVQGTELWLFQESLVEIYALRP